jgi:hypothetical protein
MRNRSSETSRRTRPRVGVGDRKPKSRLRVQDGAASRILIYGPMTYMMQERTAQAMEEALT